jgi:hypothetical protein
LATGEDEGDEDDATPKPLTPRELREIRGLVKKTNELLHHIDNYWLAWVIVRNVSIGFGGLVFTLYQGRDLISRMWKAVFPP